jgi:hypothetical protein
MTERTLKVKRHAVCVMCKDFEWSVNLGMYMVVKVGWMIGGKK